MASDWRQWRSKVLQGWEVEEILGDAIVEGGAGSSLLSLPPEVLLPLVLGRLSPRELLLNVALVSRAFCLLAHDDFLWKAHYSQRYKMFEFQLDAHQGNEDEDPTTTTTTTALPCYDTWKAFFASRVVAQLPFHGVHLEICSADIHLSEDQLTVHLDVDHTGDFNIVANGPLLPFPGIPGGQRVGYFEVSFNNAGPSRVASVGLAIPQYAQHHLGWVKGSFGYHGDDGFRFTNDNHLLYACQGRKYYAGYGDGDVVGCGYNLDKNEIFYTQNGHYLGPAFTFTPEEAAEYRSADDDDNGELVLRPSVGLARAHQDVTFNFGKRPFVFNIDAYILDFQVPEAPPFEATRREYGGRHLSMFSRRDDIATSGPDSPPHDNEY
ncbi:SPRY domain containing protein [Acanthamoeba castellanii str. Neff]|uniref:SPRY domain containing protein n=1 Tax=Acanthamoeba castellanii (strain ATCC 30010 / Neff) TaxID=1257118 RepID=L8H2J5_ACACF|nr:SPRY domain containing protein [Acanthamoeba castellanii str. Neff]ELR18968.1 SPRY domain containing protein [Acanthamoeba castellanii str. Neff]